MVVVFCFVYLNLVMAFRGINFVMAFRSENMMVYRYEQQKEVRSDKYTIVISSFDRFHHLAKIIPHWRSCPHVHQIHVVHHHPTKEFPTPLHQNLTVSGPPVRMRWYKENRLTNRFRIESRPFETELVFTVDDDVWVDCRLMTAAFQYRTRNPNVLVGFAPRLFDLNATGQGYEWNESCKGGKSGKLCLYNTVWTTKGAFLSLQDLENYWADRWKIMREMVDQFITGEDMLMSTVLSASHMPCPEVHSFYASGWETRMSGQRPIPLPGISKKNASPSLGDRTSDLRANIREALHQHAPKGLCMALNSVWIEVSANGTTNEITDLCPRPNKQCG